MHVVRLTVSVKRRWNVCSSSQVFNDKVNGKFIRKQKDEKKKKKRWKKIVRKML